MPPQPPITHIIEQPLKGVVRAISREAQGEPSLISSVNVVPYGPVDGFRRLTQRSGVAEFGATGKSVPVQGMLNYGYILQPGAVLGPASFALPSFALSNFTLSNGAAISSGQINLGGAPSATVSVSTNPPPTPGFPSTSTATASWTLGFVPWFNSTSGPVLIQPQSFGLAFGLGANAPILDIYGAVSTFGGHIYAVFGSTNGAADASVASTNIDVPTGVPLTAKITISITATRTGPTSGYYSGSFTAGNYSGQFSLPSLFMAPSISTIFVDSLGETGTGAAGSIFLQ